IMNDRNDNNDNRSFTYTYSASQREELERIRQKYLPPEEDKLAKLRRLDKSALRKGTIAALTVGIVGTLLLGLGMCCTIVWMGAMFIPGIIIGTAGIALVALASPIYAHITKKERERIAPEILRLTDELLK
ncbi:MAG: hypothetical protein ACI4T6_06870, partial [Candidatus Flemingiibacterium sp.]